MTATDEPRADVSDVTGAVTGAVTVEMLNRTRGEFNERIGVEFVEASPDRIVATLPVAGNRQPYGVLHGGANAALAETLGSVAAAVNAGPGKIVMGLELSCTHHRSVRSGTVTGVCVPLHVGRTAATFETVITDEDGRRTCTARLTCVIKDAPRD